VLLKCERGPIKGFACTNVKAKEEEANGEYDQMRISHS